MQRPSPAIIEAKRAEIRRRYRQRKKRTPAQLASLRLADLAKLFRARYGLVLPDDDAGREDAAIALAHMASLATARARMVGYLANWAPWLPTGEAQNMIDHAFTHQQYWRADQLAWRLRLTAADRAMLGITTIGAIDLPKRGREQARKRRARARAKRWREQRKLAAYAP